VLRMGKKREDEAECEDACKRPRSGEP